MKKIMFLAVFMCIFLVFSTKVWAQEGSICHKHSEACYEIQDITCVDSKYSETRNQDFYCNTCQGVRSAKYIVERYKCEYVEGTRDYCRAAFCWACGSVVLNETGLSVASHIRQGEVCICGYDETTVVATVSLSADKSEWTNGNVILTANIQETATGSSLAPYTYQFSSGSVSGNSCEVSENGTYAVTVTGVNGQQATASVQVNNIDKEAPIITTCYVDKSYPEYNSANIIVEGTDALSGLSGNAYSFDGGKTFVANNSFAVTQNGTYTICVSDIAGNQSVTTLTVNCFARKPVTNSTTEVDKTITKETIKSEGDTSNMQTEKVNEKQSVEKKQSEKENTNVQSIEKVNRVATVLSLEKIPGVYSSVMKQKAEEKAVPSFLGTRWVEIDEYNGAEKTVEKPEESGFLQDERKQSSVSFAQVSRGVVGGSVLLCIGMVSFLLVFLVKKL